MLHVEILYWSFKFDEIGEVNAGPKFRFGMANVFSRGEKGREKKETGSNDSTIRPYPPIWS